MSSAQAENQGIVGPALKSALYYLTLAEKRKAVGMFALLVLSSLLDVFGLATLVPVIMAASRPGSVFQNKYSLWLYQTLGFQTERSFLVFLILGLLVFFLLKNLFTTFINYQQVKFTAYLGLKIIEKQVDKHHNFPYLEYMRIGSAQLVHSTLGVPQAFIGNVIRQLFTFFQEIIIIAIIVVGILVYQPSLFIILMVVLVPATVMTYRALRTRSAKLGQEIDILRPISHAILTDAFIGFIDLKLANKQKFFKERLLANEKRFQNVEALTYLYGQLPVKVIEMVAIMAVVTIFLYSLFFSQNVTALVTTIGLFAAAAYRLMPSVNRMIIAMVALKQFKFTYANMQNYREYAEMQKPEQQLLPFNREIRFDNLTFTFPDTEKPVLDHVSFTVQKGEKIGIIGSSGSGKTTLMNLLLRFYKEQEGAIRIDGQPLNDANLEAWYRLVGYVKQDTFLMDTTIRDNITLMDAQVDEARLTYAIEQASLADFIAGLPEGVDTRIGERGARLSGGQRQRIGIARALYKRTEVLVMDEATSALDNETEREVNEAIGRLAHTDITIFIVAHRITTLRDCNRIYELRAGELYAEHRYEDLVNKILTA
ncbi:ABC transporter ATP-binding protein [Hymenobacter sp. 102]|uniref:ABC transporter ATP-binding protein n=1 Tax=Hymenobacter sp. 102 TaxID=3403152 RepID=UPI003CEAD6A6